MWHQDSELQAWDDSEVGIPRPPDHSHTANQYSHESAVHCNAPLREGRCIWVVRNCACGLRQQAAGILAADAADGWGRTMQGAGRNAAVKVRKLNTEAELGSV